MVVALTYGQSVGLVVVASVMMIGSGIIGLVARKKVSGTITVRHAFGPTFRIASGVGLLVMVVVAAAR